MAEPGQITAHLTTDTGLVREHNEDYIACREPVDSQDLAQNGWIYLVADGVGGADAGEVASHFASERMIAHFVENSEEPDWGRRLLDAMQAANSDLRQLVAERNNNSRMATTMVTAVLQENQVFIGNVGDSRAYHWRNGLIQQITRDQSLVAKLLEEGAITAAEAESHPRKNVILYSLGSENKPKIDLFTLTLLPGDIVLLCSDGLTRHVADREINDILGQKPPDEATDLLTQMARQRGGEDNISVVVIRYGAAESKGAADTAVTRAHYAPTQPHRSFLWLYTGFLAVFMILLIFIAWLVLRV